MQAWGTSEVRQNHVHLDILQEFQMCSGVTSYLDVWGKRVSKWRLACLVPRIKGKAFLLHELEQGISNRSALGEEIIKRDVRVVGRGEKYWLTQNNWTQLLHNTSSPKYYNLYGHITAVWRTWLNTQKLHVLPTQCICVFCVDLRTSSDYFTVQH